MTETEQKAAYFAQYWGQSVYDDSLYKIEKDLIDKATNPDDGGYLVLHPLSAITDDECIEVAKISGRELGDKLSEIGKYIVDIISENPSDRLLDVYPPCFISLIDYLRSRSFALPFRGISVDELINMGWLKLRKEEIK